MRLSDIMSRMGLTTWAEVALVIFFGVFVGIAIYVFAVRKRSRWEKARYLPLEQDPPAGDDDQGSGQGPKDE
ncbi:MAG: hypothetical protein AMXMBFR64_25550 [Myxococcales bacterium]